MEMEGFIHNDISLPDLFLYTNFPDFINNPVEHDTSFLMNHVLLIFKNV